MQKPNASRLVLLAPVIFVLHVVEEAPGFVAWFNSLVTPGISESSFLRVNAWVFVITLALVLATSASRSSVAALVTLAWLALVMFMNGIFHITATIVHARYAPGVITGALVYLPFYVWLAREVMREFRVGFSVIAIATTVGSIPMAAHGFLIVFRGSRLF